MKGFWLVIFLNILPFICSAALTNKLDGVVSPSNSKCSTKVQQKCQCGKYFRNLTSTRIIAGKTYDTLVPMGDGLDGKVDHAFSRSAGRCVAIKSCSEDPTRLSKCTRELNVLRRMNEVAPHIVRLDDFEVKTGQPCTEGAVVSDFIRTVLIGTEKRKKRQTVDENGDEQSANGNGTIGNSCNEVVLVEELGSDEVEHFLRETKRTAGDEGGRKGLSLQQIKAMIRKAMDGLHAHGIAHRDMHKDNAMLFPLPPLVNHSKFCEADQQHQQSDSAQMTVKVIDMGWACCFDAQKCGPLVSATVPECAARKALKDDEFSLQDVFKELEEL